MTARYNSPPNWPTPPAGWTPSPDWKPNPSWGPAPAGWNFWLTEPAPQGSWVSRHKVLTGVVAGAVLFTVIGVWGADDQPDSATPPADPSPTAAATQDASSPEPKKAPAAKKKTQAAVPKPADDEPASEDVESSEAYGSQPKDQQKFVSAIIKAQEAADDADNDMKIGAALSKRNRSLCKIVDNGRTESWTGTISSLDANGDGKGVVEIAIADDVHVGTWNNAFSDVSDGTLLEPGPLFDAFLELEEGQLVTFSGKLMSSGEDCVNDSRLTLRGKLADPSFIFKFSAVGAN